MSLLSRTLPAALFAATLLPLHASTIDTFTLTSGTDVATFSLPASPTPTSSLPNSLFTISGVTVLIDGVSTIANITFFNSGGYGGGLDISNGTDLIDQKGFLLFSGPVTAPTFNLGTFPLTLATTTTFPFTGLGTYKENFSLVIADASTPAAAPEPPSAALFATGLLSISAILGIRASRRRLARSI